MYYGSFQFPNLMLNLHPDCAMSYIAYPHGPAHTTVVSEFLFRPEAIALPDFAPEPVVELWDLISRQDWAVCERAQTGVSSRSYRAGVYPRKDRLPVRLQRAVPPGDGTAAAGLIRASRTEPHRTPRRGAKWHQNHPWRPLGAGRSVVCKVPMGTMLAPPGTRRAQPE